MIKMFFSFEGRTRRFEYGMSLILCLISSFITIFIGQSSKFATIAYVLFIPIIWFFVAQRVQRCHDLGKSGFYMFIPFFGLLMLFAEGVPEANEYGPNPKEKK